MIPQWIALWFAKNSIMAGLIAAVLAIGLMWDHGRIKRAETRGQQKQQAKTEQANDKVIQRAGDVRARVRSPRVRGVADPHYID